MAVPVRHCCGPHSDLRHDAGHIPDGHDIAHSYRLFEKHDQTGHEIGKDLLESEAQADRHGRHQPLVAGPGNSQPAEGHDDPHRDDEISTDGDERVTRSRIDREIRQQRQFEQTRDIFCGENRGQENDDGDHHMIQRDVSRLVIHDYGPELESFQKRQRRQHMNPDQPQPHECGEHQQELQQPPALFSDRGEVNGLLFHRQRRHARHPITGRSGNDAALLSARNRHAAADDQQPAIDHRHGQDQQFEYQDRFHQARHESHDRVVVSDDRQHEQAGQTGQGTTVPEMAHAIESRIGSRCLERREEPAVGPQHALHKDDAGHQGRERTQPR